MHIRNSHLHVRNLSLVALLFLRGKYFSYQLLFPAFYCFFPYHLSLPHFTKTFFYFLCLVSVYRIFLLFTFLSLLFLRGLFNYLSSPQCLFSLFPPFLSSVFIKTFYFLFLLPSTTSPSPLSFYRKLFYDFPFFFFFLSSSNYYKHIRRRTSPRFEKSRASLAGTET